MTNHPEFIADLRDYLEYCCRQSHENMANTGFHKNVSVVSRDVMEGKCPASTTFCRHTSFIARYLLRKMFNEDWKVAGGYCESLFMTAEEAVKESELERIQTSGKAQKVFDNGWLITPDIRCLGAHWWLEKDGIILDLSADQFGHETIVISTDDDPRYIKEAERCGASQLNSIRSTAMKWLENDFGFHSKSGKYYNDLKERHDHLCSQYPKFARLAKSQSNEFSP